MAAADEIAVERFLGGEIGFLDIAGVIESALDRHNSTPEPDIEAVLAADDEGRRNARGTLTGVAV